MEVRLISLSKPSAVTGCSTAEELIAYAARVSNPGNQNNTLTAPKLIKYLLKNKHFSPFEMVSMTLEIVTTRDIARQILRHRSFSFQEFSQRYADPTTDLGFEIREARLQDLKNRQNSLPAEDKELAEQWSMKQAKLLLDTRKAYEWAISSGIAKEQARAILPEGNTVSRLYMSGTLRSWIHYCDLRMGNGTQLEHAKVAAACWGIIEAHFPNIVEAYNEIE